MILEILYLLTATAITFLFTGILLIAIKKNATVPLILAGLLLLTTGLVVANTGIQQTEWCLTNTTETSHVWNCTTLEEYCFGTPEPKSCYYYNTTQCNAIPGCEWIGNNCYGTPEWTCTQLHAYGGAEKCRETKGCYMANESNPQTCDTYDTNYAYTNCTRNHTGNPANPHNEIDALYILYILGGLFLILWGITNHYQQNK